MRGVLALGALLVSGCEVGASDDTSERVRVPLAVASASTSGTITPPSTAASVWTYVPSARAAWFGAPDAPALMAISCEGSNERAPRLAIVRFTPAEKGAEALFAIQGSKGILRLPVSAVRAGGSGYVWRGELAAADPRSEVLLGNGLKATVPGGGMLELPPMGPAGALVGECAAFAAPQTLPNRASNPATSPAAR